MRLTWPKPVLWYDVTMPSPAANLALDEVLLQHVDAHPYAAILRTWEPNQHFVVLGRSNSIETEVDEAECQREEIPIYRRASGGGAVVVGPGCLAYAIVLPLDAEMKSAGVATVTRTVMEIMTAELRELGLDVTVQGTSDLVIGDRKFSGNSQRWLRNALLHHGTVLYDYDLGRISRLLKMPSRQPDYRSSRNHHDFIMNVPMKREEIVHHLVQCWDSQPAQLHDELLVKMNQLAQSRYEDPKWNRDR